MNRMDYMDLNNAEIAVTTQHLLDCKEVKDYWVHMSDYSDMGEFLCACPTSFPKSIIPNTDTRMGEHTRLPDKP